jgi:hypothetical protein
MKRLPYDGSNSSRASLAIRDDADRWATVFARGNSLREASVHSISIERLLGFARYVMQISLGRRLPVKTSMHYVNVIGCGGEN